MVMPIDADSFKFGMRRLAAGVCLITTEEPEGTRSGMTATAVCSVSAEPPTLLCCINRQNASYAMIRRAGVFAVNVLALDDRPLADQFARPVPSSDKFSLGLWRRLITPAPILESALVAFDCTLAQSVEVGTHGILFGEIRAVHTRAVAAKPLLYAHGSYGGFASIAAASDLESLWIPTWNHEPH
jgi:flavin reductase (DIM6/NTAB) family NADH-FMN oxidoreductase RutF